ncbi:MAG: DegT/DnrJ/EryC1/StrS family aminotransferase [Gammaproteobacteria bacterium]|nr:DegT/DnrJ/EryC1/StrS family aminotransferase [Gammaproteobacteria bacterium]
MTVPLLDLKGQYNALREEIKKVIDEVCDSQYFILGPHVQKLEEQIAAYCGTGYGIGVSSGTDALLLALMALDIGSGDEVITSPYTFFATGGAVARCGARPVYCDIDPTTYNLSPVAVEATIAKQYEFTKGRLINKKTGGIAKVLLPVHLYGQVADMDPLMGIAAKYNLNVIEDAAQAIGSSYNDGRRAGSFGDVGCFSFFPSKNLGAFGDGGMCVCNDEVLAERLRIMRVHGGEPKYFHSVIGGNFRLDALQAAVLQIKLKHLDDWTAARQKNAAFYNIAFANAGLADKVSTPVALQGYRHIYNQYVIRVQQRDELRTYLTERNIGTEIYYPVPLHMQQCFSYLGYAPDDCPESRLAGEQTLALPIYPELTEQQLAYVVETVGKFYKS